MIQRVEAGALVRIESLDGRHLGEARLPLTDIQVNEAIFLEDRYWLVVEVTELDHGRSSAFLRVTPHPGIERHLAKMRRFDPQLVEDVKSVLNRHDLEELIVFGAPEDEYEPEIADILAQLPEAGDAADAAAVVQEVFSRWFDWDEKRVSYSAASVAAAGADVWAAYTAHQQATVDEAADGCGSG